MIREALTDTFGLLKNLPLLWLSGLIIAIISSGDILIGGTDQISTGGFQIFAFLLFPFIIAGSYGIIREEKNDISVYLRYGKNYYFRILLPLLIILFASFLTILLVISSTAIIGVIPTADSAFMIAMGVSVPILLLTYFYDTFAVFRDEKIFDSLKSSIALVLFYSWKVLLFIVVNIVIFGGILFGLAFVWAALLWEKVNELGTMDPDLISSMSGEEVMAFLGPNAVVATAVVLFLWAFLITPFTLTFKAAFFRRLERVPIEQQEQVGVYDEKGRWYKY
jgi:hypothetical protein